MTTTVAAPLCNPDTAESWFPNSTDRAGEVMAKKVCHQCPVERQCLGYALSLADPPQGVWGGTTEAERREMARAAA